MSRKKFTDALRFSNGFIFEHPELAIPEDSAVDGSRNVLFTGEGEPVPFKGLSLVGGIGGISGEPVGGGIGGLTTLPPELVYLPGTCSYVPPAISYPGGGIIRFTGTASSDRILISSEQISSGFVEFQIPSRGTGSAPFMIDGVQLGFIKHSAIGAPCYPSQVYVWTTGASAAGVGYFGPGTGSHTPGAWTNTDTYKIVIDSGGTVRYYWNGTLMANTDTVAEDVHLFVAMGASGYIDLSDSSFSFQI